MSTSKESVYENTNGFPMANGKNLHMDIGHGELANRIITVGAPSRLEKIAKYLDADSIRFRHTSSRGFTCVTGCYNKIPVSIVAIGMGMPMMDFFVREARNVISGPMAVIRFGTCGGLSKEAAAGTVVVANEGAAYITRNVDGFVRYYANGDSNTGAISHADAYNLSQVCPAHTGLSAILSKELTSKLGEDKVHFGVNVTGDSFYSSQGRVDGSFHDFNQELISNFVCSKIPNAASMEMETFNLYHLALCSAKEPIHASAAAIVVANRHSADVADGDTVNDLECQGGEAVLATLASFEM